MVDIASKIDNKPDHEPSHDEPSHDQGETLSQETTKALNADFKALEKATTTTQTKENSRTLAYQIETQKYEQLPLTTYTEIIAGTPLQSKILKVFSHPDFDNYPQLQSKTPEQRAEYLFRKINTGIARFYARRFLIAPEQEIPKYLYETIIPATEWFLMDMLKENKHENNLNFLSSITQMRLDTITDLFQGVNQFSKKFTYPYLQAEKLMKIVDFITLPKNRSKLSTLTNPYDFYEKIMQNPIWEQDKILTDKIRREQFNLNDTAQTESEKNQENLILEQEKIKKELWWIAMVDSPQTIKKLLDIVKISEPFFLKTEKISDQILDKMDAFKSVETTIKSVFWLDIFQEVKSSKIISGVFDFVLNILGFSWGITGLERSWRKRNIDRALTRPKKEFIQKSYKKYCEERDPSQNFTTKIMDTYDLEWIDKKYHTLFNIDMPLLQETIAQNIDEKSLNPQTLAAIKTKSFEGKEYITITKEKDNKVITSIKPEFFEDEDVKNSFIQSYIMQTIKHMSQNESFLQKTEDGNTVTFALIAGLSLEQGNSIEGIKAWALLPQEFYENKVAQVPLNQEKTNKQVFEEQEQKIKNLTFAENISDTTKEVIQQELDTTKPKSPLTVEMIISSAQKYEIPIEYLMAVVKNDSSYGTQWKAVRTLNPGNVGNTDDWSERKFESWQEGLDAAAEVIKERVDAYQSVHGNKNYPWIENLMANRDENGYGFLKYQANYKKPNEYRGEQAPFWAYMTAGLGPKRVAEYTQKISEKILNA